VLQDRELEASSVNVVGKHQQVLIHTVPAFWKEEKGEEQYAVRLSH
jgi:hypothetical protein